MIAEPPPSPYTADAGMAPGQVDRAGQVRRSTDSGDR
jgi:hypothetical protein